MRAPHKFACYAVFPYCHGVNTTPAPRSSVRDSKKLAAREALSRAALRLAVERGFEHVRVDEIAAEAGVSARTFNNYFSSKEEAICAIGLDRQKRVREAILDRPADESLWEAVIHAVMEQYSRRGEPDREYLARIRLLVGNSALQGEYLKSHAAVERALAEGIAERIGIDVDRDLYPSLVAGAVTSAVRVAIDHWLNSDAKATLIPTIRHALRQTAAGLPAPASSLTAKSAAVASTSR